MSRFSRTRFRPSPVPPVATSTIVRARSSARITWLGNRHPPMRDNRAQQAIANIGFSARLHRVDVRTRGGGCASGEILPRSQLPRRGDRARSEAPRHRAIPVAPTMTSRFWHGMPSLGSCTQSTYNKRSENSIRHAGFANVAEVAQRGDHQASFAAVDRDVGRETIRLSRCSIVAHVKIVLCPTKRVVAS